MKILFGTEFYGKDISEVPSSFLLWIIEKYEAADWLLIQACKKEFSERLKIEWTQPPGPLSQKEIMIAFRRDCLDKLYEMGWPEDKIMEAGGKEVQWSPKPQTINAGEIIVNLLKESEELKSRVEFYRWIILAHGISLSYFLKLGKMFAMSLYFRTQREGSFRLPDAFAENEVQKSPFNIFTVQKSDAA